MRDISVYHSFIKMFLMFVKCVNLESGGMSMKKTFKVLILTLLLGAFAAAQSWADGNPKVKIKTTQGTIVVELFSDVPVTTKNFVDLVSKGFYDGLTFHRYVEGFVIQGGDPTGTGSGGSDKTIPLEITAHKHLKGAIAMARTSDPNSATSQFYICLDDLPQLDGQYCVFGQVIKGMDNVMKLRQGDKMLKVTLLSGGK
jgi:peptidyl-prolyl cis-trans isomerase B (cyclophilin B)